MLQTKIPTGTLEWAEKNENLYRGKCPNGCIYCYAIANIIRYKQPTKFEVKPDVLNKVFKKRDYLTMYPSAHDITLSEISNHVKFLVNFLSSGSPILIVTKPNYMCIDILCHHLKKYQDQVEFRFTIGSSDYNTLRFYEPDAPTFNERRAAVVLAFLEGFKTSLSIEPMLDKNPEIIIERLHRFITGDIWVGKMNHALSRLSLNGHKDKIEEVQSLIEWQSHDENILEIVDRLSKYNNVKWKDSIKKVLDHA